MFETGPVGLVETQLIVLRLILNEIIVFLCINLTCSIDCPAKVQYL